VRGESTNRSFDDLARALAEGSLSRRRALKLFAGTAIASLIPSRALADDDECVRICHVPFNRDTDECDFANAVTRCVSRRERRRHLENHPCDCRGRCANCLTSTTTPTTSTSGTTPTTSTTTTCLPNGSSPCTDDSRCCSGNCENEKCCIPENQDTSAFGFCTANGDCCGVLDCIDGICLSG
jgi:hypothetical protein